MGIIPPELLLLPQSSQLQKRHQLEDLLTEPAPPAATASPSSFFPLDDLLPPAPHVDDDNGNKLDHLSYISHMLLEEDSSSMDNYLLYHPNHQAALLTAEQPFTQILNADATYEYEYEYEYEYDALLNSTTWPCNNSPLQLPAPDQYCDMTASEMQLPAPASGDHDMDSTLLIVRRQDDDDAASSSSNSFSLMNSMLQYAAVAEPNNDRLLLQAAEVKSSCSSMDDVISMAFFKGMEEANNLLPFKDSQTLDHARGGTNKKKKRLQGKDDDAAHVDVGGNMGSSRTNKQKMEQTTQPAYSDEEATAREMLNRLMLNDNDDPSHAHVQQELIAGSMDMEKKPPARRRRGAAGASQYKVDVDLHAFLIRCAQAVATNDRQGAADLLQQIRHHSSPTGDGTQRLAHCFAQGLEARMIGTGRHMCQLLVAKSASAAGILKVYKLYMAACSILPMRFPLTNNTTYKAVVGRKKLHVVHYGLGHGFNWPDLLRMLSCREGGPPEVRLTGIDNPMPGFHPGQLIEETGRRLSDCARQFSVPFKFHAIANKSEAISADDLDIDPEEVLVVISHFHFKTLMDESVIVDRPNPRDIVLNNITKMRPKVFIHANINGSYSGAFFLSRFREALNNFAAVFDMIDTTVPQENQNRLLVEQELARCAMNIIACEGMDRVERPHNYKQWQVRCERAGLRQLPLDPDIVKIIKDKVNKEYRKYIVINEDHGCLLKGWKGRVLCAMSTWTAEDARSDLGNK